jgi:Putative transmembrane protein (PGPGW)
MDFLQIIKDDYRTIRDGKAGQRFRDYVDERRKRRGGHFSIGRIVSFVVGMVLVAVGVGVGWLPGPGGFVAVIGLALIAQEIPLIADVLDWIEKVSRKTYRNVRSRIVCRAANSKWKNE